MKKSDRLTLALLVVVALAMFTVYGLSIVKVRNFVSYLELGDVIVAKGDISSPSLVLDLTLEEFLDYLDYCDGVTIVYRDAWSFYIFEPSMLVAYRYEIDLSFKVPLRD